jgi:hypothetical protein
VSCIDRIGARAFLWEFPSLAQVTRLKVQGEPMRLWRVSDVPAAQSGRSDKDWSDRCWSVAARVGFSTAFSGRLWWLLVPMTSNTLVDAWSWPTWVVESEICFGSRVRLVGVSISFEKNFYLLPFTPPSSHQFGPSLSCHSPQL